MNLHKHPKHFLLASMLMIFAFSTAFAQKHDWENPHVFGINKLPYHATLQLPSRESECKEIIEAVGVEKIVLDSDYGQKNNGSPVKNFLRFIDMVKETCDLNDEEIKMITETNPAWLLGI